MLKNYVVSFIDWALKRLLIARHSLTDQILYLAQSYRPKSSVVSTKMRARNAWAENENLLRQLSPAIAQAEVDFREKYPDVRDRALSRLIPDYVVGSVPVLEPKIAQDTYNRSHHFAF